jgi:hypothetical protein
MSKVMLLNGASPIKLNQGPVVRNKKIKTLSLPKFFSIHVTDKLYQAEYSIGKRKIGG